MKDSKEILAVGSIAFDSIKTSKGDRNKILGGSCTYFSVASSYYTKTSIIGVVGDDFSEEQWSVFKQYNINTKSVEILPGNTFSWGGKYNEDYSHRETLFTHLGVFENFQPKIKTDYLNPILYLGNIQPDLQLDVISKIDSPYLIAADSMNLWIDLSPDKVWELISKVNIFFINDEEAMQLTNQKNLENIADILINHGPEIVIIKMGGEGALITSKNKKTYISIVPNTSVFDPTGAGDSFAGGTLGFMACNGIDDPVKAALHGTAIASYTVSGFGLENLYQINKDDLNQKIHQITIK